MYYMPTISLRVSDDERALWVEAAGGQQKLSAWIRSAANGALTERGVVAAAPNDRDITNLATESTVTAAPRSVIAPRDKLGTVPEYRRLFKPDFKKPVAAKPGRR